MAGGDETAAVHGVVTANAAGDRAAVLANLETLLLALGRVESAEVVRRAVAVPAGVNTDDVAAG